jgi:hypothetical protein
MATLKNTVIQGASNYVSLPNQTVSTAAGTSKLRYNTANPAGTGGGGALEFYDGTAWRPVTGFSPGLIGTGGNSITYQHGSIVHVFTSTGGATFTPAFTGTVQVLVVGGGGSSGYDWAAGGGGGGVIMNRSFPVTSGTPYPVNVGAGGGGRTPTVAGPNGGSSTFSSITASGGGGGGSWSHSSPGSMDNGNSGGRSGASGGGGANTGDGVDSRRRSYGGMGTAGQGFPGGSGLRFNVDIENTHQGGGGGGASGPGASAPDGRQNYRGSFRSSQIAGGAGRASDILGSGATLYYAGGGGGGGHLGWGFSDGGIGGGGGGSHHHGGPYGGTIKQSFGGGYALNDGQNGQPTARGGHGGANTGGGAGGGQHGADGGTGVVIVKY